MVPFFVPAMQAQDAEHDSIDVLHYRLTLDMGHNAVKKLHVTFFRTLQISFSTKNEGDDFCIKNIEFERVKVKNV